MISKDNEFCAGEEGSEQNNENTNNPFCKELSPIEYYNYERGLDNSIRKCRCTNQELLVNDFCEICNAYVF